ncbi:MAG: D-lactate dehydrogenase [Candidatus Neomarinimicrobiota bacterium]
MSHFSKDHFIKDLSNIIGEKNIITTEWGKLPFSKGWRYGEGEALAVAKPGTLFEIWQTIQVCVDMDIIIIMQAANTGLTGGSTPFGDDYDRPILIINTRRISNIHVLNEGKQIVSFAGSTLVGLEKKLAPYGREPHSVIGSSCIGASIVGGVCNNSGGALIKRGPAYTELALYAKIDTSGNLVLINDLGIELGDNPKEILYNLQNQNYNQDQIKYPDKLASDNEYEKRVRNIEADTPSRFNADRRRLHGASGCAGKVAVFAVRLDTYPIPKRNQVFYIGTNSPRVLTSIRRDILSQFKHLPTSGEYLHRDCYDAAKKYSKDAFIVIDKLGADYIPKLFEFKRIVDLIADKVKILPDHFSDRLMQFLTKITFNHLPLRMEDYRDKYEHHWIIETSDKGIEEAKEYFDNFFQKNEGNFFECNEKEAKKAILHRFVAASALGRYYSVHKKDIGSMLSLDIALPRNELDWFENLPEEIDSSFEMKLYYGHLFCHVLHHNYIVKKGVNGEELMQKLLKYYDSIGAEYPAEHNVGHEYFAKPLLSSFYKDLDPTNSFNPGIGKTSKKKFWS